MSETVADLTSYQRALSLRLAIIFAIACVALFYFGGGEFICGEEYLSPKGNFNLGDVMIGGKCAALEISGKWYGIRSFPRFFGNTLIQAIMIGGSIGAFFTVLKFLFQAVTGIEVKDED